MSGFTPLLFAYVFAAVFLAGIVRGATGFGFSMIMIVLLTLFFPPAQVAPVILFWEVLASIGHLPFVYKQVHWKSLRWLALGVALGTPFGVYCLVSIPVDAMRLIINAVVLILTSMLYCGLRPKNAPTPPQTTGVGLAAGVINGASANGGASGFKMAQTDKSEVDHPLFPVQPARGRRWARFAHRLFPVHGRLGLALLLAAGAHQP